jgi:hypothetical protein
MARPAGYPDRMLRAARAAVHIPVILTFFCLPGEEAKSTPLRKALKHALAEGADICNNLRVSGFLLVVSPRQNYPYPVLAIGRQLPCEEHEVIW